MEVIDKWAAEFFIRRQHNPRASPTNLLSALKLEDSSDSMKLKISSVFRDISDSLIRGNVDEGTLDLLEILEKLLLVQQGSVLMESHKSAYCWTAAECTLRFMWPLSASEGLFTDAVERIWTKRIGLLKESGSGLVTSELLKWETDMKMALEDSELYKRIRETNIRYIAISFLTQLLKEQWALLGSSTLESVTQRRVLKRKAVNEQYGSEEEGTMGAQEQEHEPSLDKGNKKAATELKEYVLEIQRRIDPSTRHVQEPNNAIDHSVDVTPQPGWVNRTGTSCQDHNKTLDNASEKGSDSQGTWPGIVRSCILTPVPLNQYPLKQAGSSVRRRKKYWTTEEVEALREGVKEYGKSWKVIKNANPEIFVARTEVDLKDKWRNLAR